MPESLRSALALEEILGTNWLNKIGVIILVLGVALFGIYELGQLGPFGKVGLSLAVAATLLGFARWEGIRRLPFISIG